MTELEAWRGPSGRARLLPPVGGGRSAVGAEVDVWDPDPADVAGTRQLAT